MQDSTKEKYRADAKGFYNCHFDGNVPNKDDLLSKLKEVPEHYSSKSFSNLKLYLAFDMEERGEKEIAQTVRKFNNPTVTNKSYKKPKRKIKTLSDDDVDKIYSAAESKYRASSSENSRRISRQLLAALNLADYLGCRPCEMTKIKRTDSQAFFITGAKKDEFGGEGLDRHLEVDSESLADRLDEYIAYLRGATMSQVRDNFRYLMEKVFPRKKKLPTLYAFRHIMGSNLKASDFSRKEMAYIMGHQSTRTLENYGYRNSGKGGGLRIMPAVSVDAIQPLIRNSHTKRTENMEQRLEINKVQSPTYRDAVHVKH